MYPVPGRSVVLRTLLRIEYISGPRELVRTERLDAGMAEIGVESTCQAMVMCLPWASQGKRAREDSMWNEKMGGFKATGRCNKGIQHMVLAGTRRLSPEKGIRKGASHLTETKS